MNVLHLKMHAISHLEAYIYALFILVRLLLCHFLKSKRIMLFVYSLVVFPRNCRMIISCIDDEL